MKMLTIKEFQDAHRPWVKHNFGDRPVRWPAMGVVEEVGELAHAVLKCEQGIRGTPEQHAEAMRDAIGDITVFASDLASSLGWEMCKVLCHGTFHSLQQTSGTHPGWEKKRPLGIMAKCAGLLLDLVESEGSDQEMRGAFIGLFFGVSGFCQDRGWSLETIVNETWAEVSKRDWKKYPGSGLPPKITTPVPERVTVPDGKLDGIVHEEYPFDQKVTGVDFASEPDRTETVTLKR